MSQYPFEADTARLESGSSIVQSSWNSWHSSATCRNLRLLVNTSHAVAITVSCLQSVQLNSFPYLWTIPFRISLQLFTTMSSQITVYRVLTPCSLVRRHLNSGVIWNLNTEIVCSSNTSLRTSKTTQHTTIWNDLQSAFYLTIELSEAAYCKQNSQPDTDAAALVLGKFGKFLKHALLHNFVICTAVSTRI
jgi:hypothetical protein